MTDDSYDKPGNGIPPHGDVDTRQDNDPERTLITLDQLSQTIEVMTDVVNRLRSHLSEQITAKLAHDEERGLAEQLALKSLHDDLLADDDSSSAVRKNELTENRGFETTDESGPQNPINALVTARLKKPSGLASESQIKPPKDSNPASGSKNEASTAESNALDKPSSLIIEISQESDNTENSTKRPEKVLH